MVVGEGWVLQEFMAPLSLQDVPSTASVNRTSISQMRQRWFLQVLPQPPLLLGSFEPFEPGYLTSAEMKAELNLGHRKQVYLVTADRRHHPRDKLGKVL